MDRFEHASTTDPAVVAWLEEAGKEVLPKIKDSVLSIASYAGSDPNAQSAVEIGFTLLLGKPLMIVVSPGSRVPDGLAKAAYAIIEAPGDPEKLTVAIQAVLEQLDAEAEAKEQGRDPGDC